MMSSRVGDVPPTMRGPRAFCGRGVLTRGPITSLGIRNRPASLARLGRRVEVLQEEGGGGETASFKKGCLPRISISSPSHLHPIHPFFHSSTLPSISRRQLLEARRLLGDGTQRGVRLVEVFLEVGLAVAVGVGVGVGGGR